MMENVLTLIAGTLDENAVALARTALSAQAGPVGGADWLAPGIACDLPFDGLEPGAAMAAVRAALDGRPVDVVAQRAAGRRKRLLIADMESTMIENEMLDELAAEVGLEAKIADITARAMAGELDFEGSIIARVAMLEGLEEAALDRALNTIRFTRGAATLVATMRANGAYCALVSGGFEFFTRWVRARLGFDMDQANKLGIRAGKLSGKLVGPILGREAKRAALARLTAAQGITVAAAIAVGDGANDLDMLIAAGMGVAFHAKPIVANRAAARIDHGDLRALLYLQGYRQADFRE
jgi:phosphoserine phosphatase